MIEHNAPHEVFCNSCEIPFKTRKEKVQHDKNFHQRYDSTDSIVVNQYVGSRKKIIDNPMICVQHQCILGEDGCRGSINCSHYTKDLYCDVDISEFKNIIDEFGKDSETLMKSIVSKLNMDTSKIREFEVLDITGDIAKVLVSIDIGHNNLNCFMKLNDFKKMIREKNGVEVNGKFYYMEDNRTINVDGIEFTVKIF